MPETALLAVHNLCVELSGRTVLSDISFRLAPGAITGICGESGSGKTTLAMSLLRLLPSPPYCVKGEAVLDGRNLLELTDAELERLRGARISAVFQDPLLALNPVLRIRTQLTEILRAHEVERDPGQLLSMVGLGDGARILESYPHQLSGGERQRVTIAQALACKPELVIADEPFTALDEPRIVDLAALFRQLRDETGAALLVISHSPGVLARLCDEVLRLGEGRIIERGTPQEVLRRGR
jgi:ABC-type glutathione transport system ATPase component